MSGEGAFRFSTYPWGLAVACAVLLSLVSIADLWFSTLFFNEELGTWIPRSTLMAFARSVLPPVIISALFLIVVAWIYGKLLGKVIWAVTGRHVAFLMTSLALGPGLIVESILKTQSGRARPRDISIFGGDHPFTPALWLTDHCERNCSFVSGHAALAFWTTAFIFLLPSRHRSSAFAAALILGALMGLARMAEGAHFLSDVFYAGLIVVGVNVWLAHRFRISGDSHGA